MAAPRMAKPLAYSGPLKIGNAAIFLNQIFEVSNHMIVPKMPGNTPNRNDSISTNAPAMQGLRDGGGTMKVFGNGHVPMMQGMKQGGQMKMSTGGNTPTVTPSGTMHKSGKS